MAGEDDAPGEDYAELPVAGSYFFEEEVAGDFEDYVAYLQTIRVGSGDGLEGTYEVDGLNPIVFVGCHV